MADLILIVADIAAVVADVLGRLRAVSVSVSGSPTRTFSPTRG
jgi:hypothetical protein